LPKAPYLSSTHQDYLALRKQSIDTKIKTKVEDLLCMVAKIGERPKIVFARE
jgi:hypothetical protein